MTMQIVAPEAGSEVREFLMTDEDFAQIAHLAGELTGIVLGNHKRNMVYSRIARRVRACGYSTFRQYLDYLEKNLDAESTEFINSLTTNLTSFFREEHHFTFLKEALFPQLRFANKERKRLRIWSAGCSIGQEAYSIAITLRQVGFPSDWDIKILATDLDSNVLDTGRSGVYPASHVEGLEQGLVKRFFLRSRDERSVQVKDEIRSLVYFKRLNLLENWPVKGPFDVIFCRNVVIYFNKDTQRILFDRYADLLPIGGHLMIGHSENLSGITDRFESLGNTIYRKIK
ncbi:CheR family methyltransferase [Thalassolituus hydrocarboniclasticus]|nr:protein-glutamate O-methyltransferase CheR [Thalassolituus hydrocarboniclasticus]